ncbi:iron-containing redox enzyme family protein [Paraburkholderia sp. 2C]
MTNAQTQGSWEGPAEISSWFQRIQSMPLDAGIIELSREPELHERLEASPPFQRAYLDKVADLVGRAFGKADEAAVAEAHAALFALYELQLCAPDDLAATNQHEPLFYSVRRRIESAWLKAEQTRLQNAEPVKPADVPQAIKALCVSHSAAAHPLFDFLAHRADHAAMDRFFLSDSALNIRFFDLLALALVGSGERARPELVRNLWDESGRGDRSEAHVRTFRDLLDARGLSQGRSDHAANLSWQGLAGHNLFMLTALNRMHSHKSLGVMAVTELIDPASYEQVVHGCRRLGYSKWQYRYYAEHIEVDVVHGQGWLDNVITPTLERAPDAAADILFGARLRLASCQQYYDFLFSTVASSSHESCTDLTQ